ncbi:MAG: hypothetical protein CMI26_14530 [Opitutae bacterium]|nr:hypothetical protein [Opitutae bacterium]
MNSEPESMDALLGEPPSDPSSSSVERGKFSLLRVFGLFSAFFFLVFFLFLLGISLNEITVGTMIWVIAVSLVPSLFLLIRFGKVFLSYVPASIANCFATRSSNLKHAEISACLAHLTLGIGLLALVAGTVFAIFSFPDPVKMKTLAIPAFWGALLAMILCLFSLFQKHAVKLPQFPNLNQKVDMELQGLGIRCFTFTKLSLGLILITIIWFFGIHGIFEIFGELFGINPFLFFHVDALCILFFVPSLLLATFPDDFFRYSSKAIGAFFRKQKPNPDFVEISRVGGKFALYGAILVLSFYPICQWPRIVTNKDWYTDIVLWFPEGAICHSLGTFSLGLLIWTLFKYLQYAFSERK